MNIRLPCLEGYVLLSSLLQSAVGCADSRGIVIFCAGQMRVHVNQPATEVDVRLSRGQICVMAVVCYSESSAVCPDCKDRARLAHIHLQVPLVEIPISTPRELFNLPHLSAESSTLDSSPKTPDLVVSLHHPEFHLQLLTILLLAADEGSLASIETHIRPKR